MCRGIRIGINRNGAEGEAGIDAEWVRGGMEACVSLGLQPRLNRPPRRTGAINRLPKRTGATSHPPRRRDAINRASTFAMPTTNHQPSPHKQSTISHKQSTINQKTINHQPKNNQPSTNKQSTINQKTISPANQPFAIKPKPRCETTHFALRLSPFRSAIWLLLQDGAETPDFTCGAASPAPPCTTQQGRPRIGSGLALFVLRRAMGGAQGAACSPKLCYLRVSTMSVTATLVNTVWLVITAGR